MYDVIVVGSGPSGATAAMVAARGGLHTLLLDRESFPREKPCGDAIPIQCVRLLDELGVPAFTPEQFYAIDKFYVEGPHGTEVTVPLHAQGKWSSGIISRYVFDEAIRQCAVSAGVEFRQVQVSGPIVENGRVVGVAGKEDKKPVEFRAKVVIAADGATSAIARALLPTPRTDHQRAIALRGYIKSAVPLNSTIDLVFLREAMPGYAWFFPMNATTANIGVGMRVSEYNRQDKTLQQMLDLYLQTPQVRRRVGDNPVTDVKSWQVPLNVYDQQRVFDGAILAGDAGGFVDPLTGAGIYQSVVTGNAAAKTAIEAIRKGDISAAGLALYDKYWRATLGGEIRRSNLFYQLVLTVGPRLMDSMLFVAKRVPALMTAVIGKV